MNPKQKSENKIIKRIIFWLLLLFFIIAGIWWTLYLPYDENALYRVIPPDALIVSEHNNLADRWKSILQNKSIRNLLASVDGHAISPDSLIHDKGLDWIMTHFAARKSLIAYVPELGLKNTPCWIFSSWTGGNIQYLKRGFLNKEISILKKQNFKNGDIIWQISGNNLNCNNLNLSIAVYDGVIFGCLSDDPIAVRYLLRRMRAGIPTPVNPFAENKSNISPDKYMPDKLWLSKWLTKSYSGYTDIIAGIYSITINEISAGIYMQDRTTSIWSQDMDMPHIFKDISSILKVTPDSLTISGIQNLKDLSVIPAVNNILTAFIPYKNEFSDNAPIFAALFGDNSSGRIMGLRVPTLLIGIKVKSPELILNNFGHILDTANSFCNWGLIPNRMIVADNTVIGINSTRGGIYNSISTKQRPAISASGNWLLFASNANAFNSIIAQPPKEKITSAIWPVWVPMGNDCSDSLYAWADLLKTGQSIRHALGVWSIALSVGSDSDKIKKKKTIKQVHDIIVRIQSLGNVSAWTRKAGNGALININIKNK